MYIPLPLPCGAYWSVCSLMSVFMATPRLHKPEGKLLTPDHCYNWNNPLGAHWNCGHPPQYYIWLQIELFNMQSSYEQHVKTQDRDGCFPHSTMHYIFTLNWKREHRHLAKRCNYRPFKDNRAWKIKKNPQTYCKSARMCTCSCACMQAHKPVSMGKWLLFSLTPCPLVQKTVKSEIKRLGIEKPFSLKRLFPL